MNHGVILPTLAVFVVATPALFAVQSPKPKSGPSLVGAVAEPMIPKGRDEFPLFYYPPKSNPSQVATQVTSILKNSKIDGLLLIIGSEDTSLLPLIVKEIFPKFNPGRLKGARFILVGSAADRLELTKIVQQTGAECDFGALDATVGKAPNP